MFLYLNRLPYSQHPVRAIHMVLLGAFLLLFGAGCYFFGVLLTVRLLLLVLMLYAAGLSIFIIRRVVDAWRTKETRTLYGPVSLAERPTLFVVLCAVQVLAPLALMGVVIIMAQGPKIQLFHWIWTR